MNVYDTSKNFKNLQKPKTPVRQFGASRLRSNENKNQIRLVQEQDDSAINSNILQTTSTIYSYEESLGTRSHFFINDSITGSEYYYPLIFKLNTASEYDQIDIHLNTEGGDIGIGMQIINAIRNTRAHVKMVLDGYCFSLGTLLYLVGDSFSVSPYSQMMFHNVSLSLGYQKGNDHLSGMKATMSWFTDISKHIYKDFLSDDEIDRVLRGEDIWLEYIDIVKRLNLMLIKRNPIIVGKVYTLGNDDGEITAVINSVSDTGIITGTCIFTGEEINFDIQNNNNNYREINVDL